MEAIQIDRSAPTLQGFDRVRLLRSTARAIHVTTRESVIRNFLLLRVGDVCTELRRAESERILRAQNFLADATVVAVSSPTGGVVLQVRTVDELSIILGGVVVGKSPFVRGVTLGNSNLGGTTTYISGSWREGGGYRDATGGRFQHQQIFGRPYSIDLQAERRSLGDAWRSEIAHPYFTDIQRIAWRVRSGALVDYTGFPTDSTLDRALRVDRRFFDFGGVVRVGPPGRLTLLGASLSGDDERPARDPVIIGPSGLVNDPDPALRNRYVDHRMARANILWGVRDLTFKSRKGLDALTATQDVAAGFQLGTMFGRSLSVLGSRDDDVFVASDLYLGIVGRYSTLRVQLQGEGRRRNDTGAWDGILSSGRAAQYVKTSDRNTLVMAAEWSGGWHQRIPFNLSLADRRSGVRGFGGSRQVGGQRVVGRAESRWVVGPISNAGDFGFAIFGDAGRLYAGDVPFGSGSKLVASTGISLLAAVPKRSARLWRMDIAIPVRGGSGGRGVELRISGADNTKFFFREPEDVERTRELTVPSSVFRWP